MSIQTRHPQKKESLDMRFEYEPNLEMESESKYKDGVVKAMIDRANKVWIKINIDEYLEQQMFQKELLCVLPKHKSIPFSHARSINSKLTVNGIVTYMQNILDFFFMKLNKKLNGVFKCLNELKDEKQLENAINTLIDRLMTIVQ
ncbi:hypothetical protein RFI_02597 [Reticulomyxa filosa]|uniref:Uncharacterized protein n=1 Tax=Reticulomyxa filosa TaxID=46433 RepID=X6PA19_RETFI|nr:hypothetical protein RFI_02597 [Reticulomyxa filosa]|eukprot:ETO34497.1 hypothetical protein RFI_02597 [Reticulomyxa filosa]